MQKIDNPYTPPESSIKASSYKIYPPKDLLKRLDMTWLCCYIYVCALVAVGLYVTLRGSLTPYTFTIRDGVSVIFYAIAGYQLHKRKFEWAVIALFFYVADKVIFRFNFGLIDYWPLQVPFFAGFLSGSIAYVQYLLHQRKKQAEFSNAAMSKSEH